MTYEYLKNLKQTNQTLKLLSSDNIALSVSFFFIAFIQQKNITLNHTAIVSLLDDYLYSLNQSYENLFPKSAKEYLEDFCSERNGYLRKYHGSDDEPLYELTPHTQKALEFLESLEKKEFVGSRSKFNVIFELLEDLEFETNFSDAERIVALQKQKEQLDAKIEAIRSKKDIRFDSSRVKEHFMLLDETARKLKYDFTEIEYNFRELNRLAMEQIATREDAKSEVLGSIFDIEETIRQQDQGKSFFAFWQLLTDAQRSEKLASLIENLYQNPIIKEFDRDERLKELKYELLQSGQKISAVSSKLIEQLRRYIDDRAWIENRRILELCKSIEKTALAIKGNAPKNRDFLSLKTPKANIKSVFESSLYEVSKQKDFIQTLEQKSIEIDLGSFYHQFFIDEEELKRNIKKILLHKPQCTIKEISKEYGITKGIAELVGYLSIAKNSANARVEEEKQKIQIVDFDGDAKVVSMPKIVFVR